MLSWRTGQIAIGNIIGHGVVEQRHMLGDQRNMAPQITQAIPLDRHPIHQNLPLIMGVETGDQIGQGGLATSRATNQSHHLTGLDGETDILQHRLVGTGIAERQVVHFNPTAHPIPLDGTGILLRLLIQLLEDALGGGNTLLDIGADFGELPDGFGQQAGSGDIGHQVTHCCLATHEQDQEHDSGHGAECGQLQHGGEHSTGTHHFQAPQPVVLTGVVEPVALVGLTTEAAHHSIVGDGFRSHMGNVTHRRLNLLALLAELLAGTVDHQTDQR